MEIVSTEGGPWTIQKVGLPDNKVYLYHCSVCVCVCVYNKRGLLGNIHYTPFNKATTGHTFKPIH